MRLLLVYLISCSFWQLATAELRSQLYELPSLIVEADQIYLQKKIPTNLTCALSAGYSEARLTTIFWLKDGEFLKPNDEDFVFNHTLLVINGAKLQNEGEYQCLADISNIRLSNRQLVGVKLISPTLKLKRARISKFEKVSDHVITVRENEVARLPCAGLPDVVPGPPTICFERHEQGGECLGSRNGTKYLTTNTGMQISLVQASDAGFYHCIVRNDYTNQTRKSSKAVLLFVRESSTEDKTREYPEINPTLIYPAHETAVDNPIRLDVVEGDDVVLECVISLAKIVWVKHNDTTPIISMNDNNSRFQQVWGNLKIKSVANGDSGIYSCIGLKMIGATDIIDENVRPRIDYNVIVHSPTGVHLSISSQADRSHMLECLATNMRYEIPTAYVNGTNMINSIEQMGFPSSTNFYTNPIRVQMRFRQSFSGSVQCLSRPAMEEAEIYGNGMERGRSMNMFILSGHSSSDELIIKGPQNTTAEIGKNVELPCVVHRVKIKSWKKDNRRLPLFSNRTKIVGSNSLRISDVQASDEGWYTCVANGLNNQESVAKAYLKVVEFTTPAPVLHSTTEPFIVKKKDDKITVEDVRGFVTGTEVRIQWSVFGKMEALTKISKFVIEVQRAGSDNDTWIESDSVDSHVRATTISKLIPDNKYMFRIRLLKDNGMSVVSQSTTWMTVELPSGDVLPTAPKIESVNMYSYDSAVVRWSQNVTIPNAAAKTFVIVYAKKGNNKTLVTQVDGTQTDATITGLELDSQYVIHAIAENAAGKSSSSEEFVFNSTTSGMLTSVRIFLDSVSPYVTFKNVALAGVLICLVVIISLIFCFVFCNIRTGAKKRSKNQANGKFLDTSYRIFNEQKVHKSRLFDDATDPYDIDVNESSPLKLKHDDKHSIDSADKFGFTSDSVMPSLYGNIGDDVESQHDPNEQMHMSANLGDYAMHNAARCYSLESRTSHEMLVYPRSGAQSTANSSSPHMNGSMQRVMAYKYPDSLAYSPAGTASSIVDTSSSGIATRTCDSPTNPPTDDSEQGLRCGGSSRNSHISSYDGGKVVHMGTFKGNTPTTFMSTFDRRVESTVQ